MSDAHREGVDLPGDATGILERGLQFSVVGRHADALHAYDQLLALQVGSIHVFNNRGVALSKLKRFQESIDSFDMALRMKPDFSEAWCNRGVANFGLGRFEDALENYDRALRINPNYPDAYLNRGNVLARLMRYEDALASHDAALALRPDFVDALVNRGGVLANLQRLDEGLESARRALMIKPDFVGGRVQECMIQLLAGDYRQGFLNYEWRWLEPSHVSPKKVFTQPRWVGQADLLGKSILLHLEQGLGDIVQFVRYVRLLASRGADVVLEVPQPLLALMASLSGLSRVIPYGEPLPMTDFHCPLLSLPLAFNTELATVPADVPYLAAPPDRIERWKQRIPSRKSLKVGFTWSGNVSHGNDHNRSIPLSLFSGLEQIPGVELVSLQKEVRPGDAAAAKSMNLLDVSSGLEDFADTAAVTSLLDLVISVDTSTAHLAGALGKPVWILLPYHPDWRWLLGREDSVWYPTARLFRQPSMGDWKSVIQRIHDALKTHAAARQRR